MRVAVFSTKPYDHLFLDRANGGRHDLSFFETRLSPETAQLASGFSAVCAFVNDDLSSVVIDRLALAGVRLIALRSAGYNNVDLAQAAAKGISVARVPAYSPHAVAEHAVALILSLNRKTHRAYNRVREGNFSLEGLMGFDLFRKTIGVIGVGLIGSVVVDIMRGFGCRILAHDTAPGRKDVDFVPLENLLRESDIVTLHCPLTPATHHLIDASALQLMKPRAFLINTSRGGIVDTRAVINVLKTGRLGGLGLDVYEEEADCSSRTFPAVSSPTTCSHAC